MAEVTRRKFMGDSAILLGSAALAASTGGAVLPLRAEAADIEYHESSCGPQTGERRSILVAYASMAGSTGGVAEAIGQTLCLENTTVDIRLIKNVTDLSDYDGVVVGSAIRSSKWLAEARRFVAENRETLSSIPVAYFLTCLTLAHPGQEPRRLARAMMDPVLTEVPEVKPVALGCFAGVLDYSKYGFAMRSVLRYKMKSKGVEEGDYRDWKAIRAWAAEVGAKMKGTVEKAAAA